MIVAAPWHVPNTVIRTDLQIPTVKEEIAATVFASAHTQTTCCEPHGATKQQGIVKTTSK
jgi:hypothetical protein